MNFCLFLIPTNRAFMKKAINSGWSIRGIKRQISISLYERLLLTEGKTLVTQIEKFLLELGRGFMFVGTHQHFLPAQYHPHSTGFTLASYHNRQKIYRINT